MHARLAGPLVGSLLLACAEYPAPVTTFGVLTGDTTGDGELVPGDVEAQVGFDSPGPAAGDLIGWSLGAGSKYGPEGDPLHPEWRTPVRVAAVEALARTRAGHGRAPRMRFSGLQTDGVDGGDGYHFYRYVAPGHQPAASDAMASFEVFSLIDAVDAAPIITLNFGSGAASEAAAYVTHLNGTDPDDVNVAARMHWGVSGPYQQTDFEIGDKSYHPRNTGYAGDGAYSYANPDAAGGGDPGWHGRPSASAADYAERALEYVAAVQAVEPDARFWVPLNSGAMDRWGGVEAATTALAPLWSEPAVAGAVIHHYLGDDASSLGVEDPDYLLFLLAGTELYRPNFDRVRRALDAARPGLELVVSEYHVAGALSRDRFSRSMEAAVGLGIANMLIFYAQIGVDAACQQLSLEFDTLDDPDRDPLLEPWYNPFRSGPEGAAAPMASYFTTRLFAEHVLDRGAPLTFSRHKYAELFVGAEVVDVPVVHAAAFVDGDGREGSVVVLHRDLRDSHTLTLDLPPGWTATAGLQWAPGRADHNTMYHPVEFEPIGYLQVDAQVQVTLPPASLVALRFVAG